ncbi:hypothetical protein JCM10207_007545 [Rhodosporidiobolus poonsookiae]
MSSRTIVVVGATGEQGNGTVSALLSSTAFSVKAVTSDPTGAKAQALLARFPDEVEDGRLTVVRAELGDQTSLEAALEGAHGLFAAWSSHGDEFGEGKNLVSAAKTSGIAHFVYSSFYSIDKATNGCFRVPFLDAKADIEEYAKQELPAFTTLMPGSFYSNLAWPMYTKRDSDGTAIFHPPFNADVGLEFVDAAHDIGVCAAAIFTLGPSATANKTYPVASPPILLADLAAQYIALTGEAAKCAPRTPEEAVGELPLPEGTKFALTEMHRWANTATDSQRRFYGLMSVEEFEAAQEELGVRATTFEEWLARTGWRV